MNRFLISGLLLAAIGASAQQQKFTVYFPFNKNVATPASVSQLEDWADKHKNASITLLEGYADKTGNALYNVDLSERRIKYVAGILGVENFDLADVKTEPYGESRAKAAHSAPDRKVTVYFTETPPAIASVPKEPSDFTKKITKANKGDKIRIPNLNFYNNSDIILPASSGILRELLIILQENPNIKIEIQGHICCQKNEENEISLKRAMAIYNLLVKKGIAAERLSYKSFGSTKPIYALPEKNEDERVANRRVEIEILSN